MIEVNRCLYMDPATGDKIATFAETTALVQSVLTTLIVAGPWRTVVCDGVIRWDRRRG